MVLLLVGGFLTYRHYRQEAVVASMHWAVEPTELLANKMAARWEVASKCVCENCQLINLNNESVDKKQPTAAGGAFCKETMPSVSLLC